jgi:hypothetical protein
MTSQSPGSTMSWRVASSACAARAGAELDAAQAVGRFDSRRGVFVRARSGFRRGDHLRYLDPCTGGIQLVARSRTRCSLTEVASSFIAAWTGRSPG